MLRRMQAQVVAPVDVPLAVVEASIVREIFLLEETLLASVVAVEGERGLGGRLWPDVDLRLGVLARR